MGALDSFQIHANTKDVSLAAVGAAPNANGATLAGQVLNFEPASATMPGILTTGAQEIAGAKTFTGAIAASNLTGTHTGTNTGNVTLGAVGAAANANGASLAAQVLNLQPASSSFPGVMTAADKVRADKLRARLLFFENIAAKSATGIHASFAGNDASNNFPGAFTNPAYPRNVSIVAAAGWDGGNVTVNGTGPDDAALSEVIVPVAASTVYGAKIFKTVTSATKGAVGVNAAGASIVTGDKLWIGAGTAAASAFGMLAVAGASEAVTVDTTYNAFTPTSAPDGAKDFVLLINE